MPYRMVCVICGLAVLNASWRQVWAQDKRPENAAKLQWQRLPDLPDSLGVAGPFVGVHNDALIVAGGANFPRPVWESGKQWHDRIYVLVKSSEGLVWKDGGRLPRPLAYGAAVSTADGVVCMGGNTNSEARAEVFVLRWHPDSGRVQCVDYPPLPSPCAYGQAALVDDVIYLAGGQSGLDLDSAMKNFWSLNLGQKSSPAEFGWRSLTPWPGPSRAFNITVGYSDADESSVFVISGRRTNGQEIEFLKDVWQYGPARQQWHRCRDVPSPVVAGTGVSNGPNHVLVLGGDDGALFHRTNQLRDRHPGFPKRAWDYRTRADRWTRLGPIPQNQVTTIPVRWDDHIIIASGEIRPRVRSAAVWSVQFDDPRAR